MATSPPEQATEVLQEANKPAEDSVRDLAETIQLGIAAAIKPLQELVAKQAEEIKQLGAQPGASPAGTAAGNDPGTEEAPSQVIQDAKMFDNWAKKGHSPFRNPLTEVGE